MGFRLDLVKVKGLLCEMRTLSGTSVGTIQEEGQIQKHFHFLHIYKVTHFEDQQHDSGPFCYNLHVYLNKFERD